MDLKTLQKLNIQYPNDIEFAKVIREIIWEKEKQQAIQNKNNFNKNEGERLSESLESMGTTFIKLGQFLATRPDIIGEEI